jgi:hypothetical protein
MNSISGMEKDGIRKGKNVTFQTLDMSLSSSDIHKIHDIKWLLKNEDDPPG